MVVSALLSLLILVLGTAPSGGGGSGGRSANVLTVPPSDLLPTDLPLDDAGTGVCDLATLVGVWL